MPSLCSHWYGTPTATGVVIGVFVYFGLFFSHGNKISGFFEINRIFRIYDNVFMGITDCLAILAGIALLPYYLSDKV